MTAAALLAALDLPAASRLDQRVPKKLLLENGASTSTDKRYINEGVDELLWLAALKPTTIGVPEYRDATREYLEVAVLQMTLRVASRAARLVELVHRAVPYPVLLLTTHDLHPSVSAAHKRWSQGETGKTVLDGEIVTVSCDTARDGEICSAFLDAIALNHQPRATLFAMYQGWLNTLLALEAARVTGTFSNAIDASKAVERRDALQEISRLGAEITRLRAAAAKEKQLARQVDINLQLKRIEAAHAAARSKL